MRKPTKPKRKPAQKRQRAKRGAGSPPHADLVVDTNVYLELYSWHDVAGAKSDADREYRFRRAGGALRFAICMHEKAMTTWGLKHEFFAMLAKFSPPRVDHYDSVEAIRRAYTSFVAMFVMRRLLHQWRQVAAPRESPKYSGTAADDRLLKKAKNRGVPLITGEGNPTVKTKLSNRSLRAKAIKEGVPVFTPEEYAADKITEDDVDRFMHRFRDLGPTYYKDKSAREYNKAQALLKTMHDYYDHALFVTKPKKPKT